MSSALHLEVAYPEREGAGANRSKFCQSKRATVNSVWCEPQRYVALFEQRYVARRRLGNPSPGHRSGWKTVLSGGVSPWTETTRVYSCAKRGQVIWQT